MCIGIIRNNSLVDGRARAEARTPATERVMLYCTWRPSALTTGPHGQFLCFSHDYNILSMCKLDLTKCDCVVAAGDGY